MNGDLGADVVTIMRAPLVVDSRYGKSRRNWDGSVNVMVGGCSVQPFAAAEVVADREFTSTHLRLFMPADFDLVASDRVVFQGQVYEVDGEPGYWRDDLGVADHIEAVIKKLVG